MRANLLLLGLALLASFALAELALRIFAPALGRPDPRLLFTTEAPIRDAVGAVVYPPHRSIRSVLLYGDEFEIDTRFRTNDLGVIDHRDYLPPLKSARSYAFVGDSYAAGVEAGKPWIPALRDRLGLQAYALGMGGTGVLGFERMLESMAKSLPFTDIVFVAITDDFFRPLWRPLVRDDRLFLCADADDDDACAQGPPIAYLIGANTDDAAVLERARDIAAASARERGIVKSWLRRSRLLLATRDLLFARLRSVGRDAMVDESFAALARVRRAHPNRRIRFVHVPDKYETERNRYDLELGARSEATGIEYVPVLGHCAWSTQLYFARDNHPDAAGYEALSDCVARLLDLEAATPDR